MSERFLVPLYQNESFLPENKQNFVMFFFRKNKQMSFVDAAESVPNTLKLVVFFFCGAWRFAWQDDSAYRKHLNHLDKFQSTWGKL